MSKNVRVLRLPFDLLAHPPIQQKPMVCSCGAAWNMLSMDATVCPVCGGDEIREITDEENMAMAREAMRQLEDATTAWNDGADPRISDWIDASKQALTLAEEGDSNG